MGSAGANSARCTPSARSRVVTWADSAVPSRWSSPVRFPRQPGSLPMSRRPELAELGFAPLEVEVDGHLVELRGAGAAGLETHRSGVSEIERDVGAGGLGGEAEAPLAGILLPEFEVGGEKRERELLDAVLDIDAGVGGLDEGEPAGGTRSRTGLGFGDGDGAEERVEVPASGACAHKVEAGFVDAYSVDIEAASPEREQADGGGNGVGVEDGLGAVGGVLFKR